MESFMGKNKLQTVIFLMLLLLSPLVFTQCQLFSDQTLPRAASNDNGGKPAATSNGTAVEQKTEQGSPGNDNSATIAIAFGLLMLALHLIHSALQYRSSHGIAILQGKIHIMQQEWQRAAARGSFDDPDKRDQAGEVKSASEKLQERLLRQEQIASQLSAQIGEFEKRLAGSEANGSDALTAVALTTRWIAESRIHEIIEKSNGDISESDRATSIKILKRYKEIFAANVNRIRPVAQQVSALAERLNQRSSGSPELINSVQGLERDIRQVEQWYEETEEQLNSLQKGSIVDRYNLYRFQEQQLTNKFNAVSLSAVEYVNRYRELISEFFPNGKHDSVSLLTAKENENQVKQVAENVPEYLMDWFDKLFQLQSQARASAVSVDSETISELSLIQQLMRDTLNRFDIQPEEINLGQTSFDSRLYDMALVTQSTQFPVNTVVGVNQCGFRRISTGEVLRRPKVVVSGMGAI